MSRTAFAFLIMLVPFILLFTGLSGYALKLFERPKACLASMVLIPVIAAILLQGFIMNGIRSAVRPDPDLKKRDSKSTSPVLAAFSADSQTLRENETSDPYSGIFYSSLSSLTLSYTNRSRKYTKSIINTVKSGRNIDIHSLRKGISLKGTIAPVILEYRFKRPLDLNTILLSFNGKATGKPWVRAVFDNRFEYCFKNTENREQGHLLQLDFPVVHDCSFMRLEFRSVYRSDRFSISGYPLFGMIGKRIAPFDWYSRFFGRFRKIIFHLFHESGLAFSWHGVGPGGSMDFFINNPKSRTAFTSEGLLPARHSHNLFLEWLIETGMWAWISILLFIHMIMNSLVYHFKFAVKKGSIEKSPGLSLLKMAGVFLFLGFHLIDYVTATPATAMYAWFFLGLMISTEKNMYHDHH
jgi:hypothetical protein